MIAILLSTYNGEKYLAEQLESLFNQTYKDFTLYVRDDGSNDGSLDILKNYKKKYSNIVIHLEDSKKNIGACLSFMWLLENVDSKYYMFCDQDDIWFPNKIQLCLDSILSEEKRTTNKAILIHTDLIVVDNGLNIISSSLWENNKINPFKIGTKYLKVINYVTGCTIIINKLARDISITKNKEILMHDYWVALCVDAEGGKIVNLPIPTIFYRQHENNVIGATKSKLKYPILNRYFHIPDVEYSKKLFFMIRNIYRISFIEYLFLRIKFYLKY